MSFGWFMWNLFLVIVFLSVAGGISYAIYESKTTIGMLLKDSIAVIPLSIAGACGAVYLLGYIKNKYLNKKNNKTNPYNIE